MKNHPLLALSLTLVVVIHFGLEPRVVNIGRQLGFVARTPPPPLLKPFTEAHRADFLADTLRFCLLLAAAGFLLYTGPHLAGVTRPGVSEP